MKFLTGLPAALILSLCALPAWAGVFKCQGADGSTIYSQTPCESAASEKVQVGIPTKIDATICGLAHDFGMETALRMRGGATAGAEKAQIGGRFAGSPAASSIIDYVFSFAGEQDVTPGRIATLTMAKCTNGGFGNVTAADIPHRDPVEQLQYEQNARIEAAQNEAEQDMLQQEAEMPSPERLTSPDPRSEANDRNTVACNRARNDLERLEDSMRAGYSSSQGERLRQRRKQLREQIRATCR